jgi:hypothetical protein
MQTGVSMADYASQVFGDLGRIALRMARFDSAELGQQALERVTGSLVAQVKDAVGEGTDSYADWRVVRFVYNAFQSLYDKLGTLGVPPFSHRRISTTLRARRTAAERFL